MLLTEFKREELTEMSKLIKELEQFVAEAKQELTEVVQSLINQELPVITEEVFALFETTGDRSTHSRLYFGRRKFLNAFGVAAILMKREGLQKLGDITFEQVISKLEQIILDICSEETWALPAHVKRNVDPNWRTFIDLFSGETASALAQMTKELGDCLSEECRQAAQREVARRVVDNFFHNPVDTFWWEHGDNNWNAVCNGNVVCAYLYSLKEGEQPKKEYLERICDGLTTFIDGYAEDGTCLEGLSYYFYGMGYFLYGALTMAEATGGAVDLLKGDWYKYKAGEVDKRTRIAEWWPVCFFASGRTLSFADGYTNDKYRVGIGCAFAKRYPNLKLPKLKMAMKFEEDGCYRFMPLYADIFWTEDYIAYLKEQEKMACSAADEVIYSAEADRTAASSVTVDSTVAAGEAVGDFRILEDAKWCVGNAANEISFACKGGHNMEPHNHNDITNFIYTVGEDVFLDDLGAGEYTKAYFEFRGRRYTILCNRSLGHNVPLIGDKEQLGGTKYCDSGFLASVQGHVGFAQIGGENAYPEGSIGQYTRQFAFDTVKGDLEIKDYFDNQGEKILVTENLVTRYLPEVCGNTITLKSEKSSCTIEVLGEAVDIRVLPKEHSNHRAGLEQVYLIQWDVEVEESADVVMKITGKK